MRIYADNAATTKMSPAAIEAMLPFLSEDFGNPSGLYTAGQKAKEALEDARERVARCINASPRQIIFTSGGSESDNQAILTAAAMGEKAGKRHILSEPMEHHAVLHTLKALEKRGFTVEYLPVSAAGLVKASDLERMLRDDTCLVTVMAANNEIGTLQPIEEIGAICRKRGVLFHTDAVQAVGHVPLDVDSARIDLLSASAHKFHGPKGTGFLYAGSNVRLEPLIHGGAQERGKRAGTENVAGIVAMTVALEEAVANREAIAARLIPLRDRLIRGLSAIPHAALNGDPEKRLPSNVNFCFEGIEGESLLLWLDEAGIAASSGSACTSGSLDPSHVLLAIGRPHDVAHGSLRLSLGEETTQEEVDYLIEAVTKAVAYLRGFSPVWRELRNGDRTYIL